MVLKNFIKKNYLSISIVITIFCLDRISKLYIIYLDKVNLQSEIYISKFLNIYLIWNEGIAFGIFSFSENYMYNLLTFLILLVILVLTFYSSRESGFKKYSLLIVLGGALGNFFDRLIYKAVPDFIDFHIGDFHWFIFNVADIFISIGVFFMILLEIIGKKKSNQNV